MVFVESAGRYPRANCYDTDKELRTFAMRDSKEFNREGDAKEVVTKTAILGLLPVMILVVAILTILGIVAWYAMSSD
jgi:hypothetical protein